MTIRLSSFGSVTVSHSPYRWSDIVDGYGCLCDSHLRELDTLATSRWGALPLSAPQLSRSFFDAAKRVRCIETGEIFKNQTEARNTLVRRDHVNMAGADQVGQVCRGQRKSAGGYTWEFVPAPTPLPVRNSRYRGGEPIRTIDSAFDTARKRIGRKDLRIHGLRHAIATWLTRDGMPLPDRSDASGPPAHRNDAPICPHRRQCGDAFSGRNTRWRGVALAWRRCRDFWRKWNQSRTKTQ